MDKWKLNNRIVYDADDPPGDPPPPVADKKDDDSPPATIPYDRFKEVNEEKTTLRKQLDDILKAQKDAEDKKLQDEKKWQELAESKDKELKAKEAELLRVKIAAQKNLPIDLIDRLKGETEEEISADADKLLEFIKSDESPGNPGKKKGGSSTVLDIKNMSPKEIREHKEELMKQIRG
jgi:hypothetical protein